MTGNSITKSKLKVSEDVLVTVVELAALDVNGVVGLAKYGFFRKKPAVFIKRISDAIEVRVGIIVKIGVKPAFVAHNVQNAVKENVQNMTGLTVARVGITVHEII